MKQYPKIKTHRENMRDAAVLRWVAEAIGDMTHVSTVQEALLKRAMEAENGRSLPIKRREH